MNHIELVNSLAGDINKEQWFVETEVKMGCTHYNENLAIVDVWAIKKSYSKPEIVAYEVKASLNDLRSDVTSGKWRKYLPFCDRVVFALGRDIKPKDYKQLLGELPVGITVQGESHWRTARRGVVHQREEISEEVWKSVLFNKVDKKTIYKQRTRHERMVERERAYQETLDTIRLGKSVRMLRHLLDEGIRERVEKFNDLADQKKALEKERAEMTDRVKKNVRVEVIREIHNEFFGISPAYYAVTTSGHTQMFREVLNRKVNELCESVETFIDAIKDTPPQTRKR